MKIIQVDDYDWYIGETLEDCVNQAMEDTGQPREEFDPRELSEFELVKLTYIDEDDPTNKKTFKEALEAAIEKGGTFPRFFASSEF